jgi:integrase
MQSAVGWKGDVAMSVYRDGKRWRYRTKFSVKIGDQIRTFRVSGTTPENENNKQKATDLERAHILRVQSEAEAAMEATTTTDPDDPAPTPTPVAPEVPAVPTVKAFAPIYLASSRLDNKLSWFMSKEVILSRHILPRVGDLRLDEITFAVVEDLKIALAETRNGRCKRTARKLNPKTINNVLTTLRHMLQVARKRGLIDRLPEITRMKAPPSKFDFLTFEESERLIAHAEGEWRTMIIVALRTGLRRGELLGLRWEDVDLVRGKLYVQQSYVRGVFGLPKSGKPREVPLSNQARQALQAHRHTRSERVFCDAEGRPFKTGILLSKLWRMCRLAKLGRKIGWHVARHSFASHLVMRGVAIRAVQEMMGHASIVITQRYAHLAPEVSRDAVQLLDVAANNLQALRADLPPVAVVPTECQNEPMDRVAA